MQKTYESIDKRYNNGDHVSELWEQHTYCKKELDNIKIVDGFIFYNEIDMLLMRLRECDPFVTYHVIVESKYTFSGAEKPLYFELNKNRLFKPYLHKIVHVIIEDDCCDISSSGDMEEIVNFCYDIGGGFISNFQQKDINDPNTIKSYVGSGSFHSDVEKQKSLLLKKRAKKLGENRRIRMPLTYQELDQQQQQPQEQELEQYNSDSDNDSSSSSDISTINYTIETNAWRREIFQRNCIELGVRWLRDKKGLISDEDIIILSDVDEIPNRVCYENYAQAISKSLAIFYPHCDSYYCSLQNKLFSSWERMRTCSIKNFYYCGGCPDAMRNYFSPDYLHLWSGGWHFSYFTDIEGIVRKIQNFAHQEWNQDKYTNQNKILSAIANGSDLFEREELLNRNYVLPYDATYPKHITERHMFFGIDQPQQIPLQPFPDNTVNSELFLDVYTSHMRIECKQKGNKLLMWDVASSMLPINIHMLPRSHHPTCADVSVPTNDNNFKPIQNTQLFCTFGLSVKQRLYEVSQTPLKHCEVEYHYVNKDLNVLEKPPSDIPDDYANYVHRNKYVTQELVNAGIIQYHGGDSAEQSENDWKNIVLSINPTKPNHKVIRFLLGDVAPNKQKMLRVYTIDRDYIESSQQQQQQNHYSSAFSEGTYVLAGLLFPQKPRASIKLDESFFFDLEDQIKKSKTIVITNSYNSAASEATVFELPLWRDTTKSTHSSSIINDHVLGISRPIVDRKLQQIYVEPLKQLFIIRRKDYDDFMCEYKRAIVISEIIIDVLTNQQHQQKHGINILVTHAKYGLLSCFLSASDLSKLPLNIFVSDPKNQWFLAQMIHMRKDIREPVEHAASHTSVDNNIWLYDTRHDYDISFDLIITEELNPVFIGHFFFTNAHLSYLLKEPRTIYMSEISGTYGHNNKHVTDMMFESKGFDIEKIEQISNDNRLLYIRRCSSSSAAVEAAADVSYNTESSSSFTNSFLE